MSSGYLLRFKKLTIQFKDQSQASVPSNIERHEQSSGPDLSSGLSKEGQLPDAEFSGLLMDSGSSISGKGRKELFIWSSKNKEQALRSRLISDICWWGNITSIYNLFCCYMRLNKKPVTVSRNPNPSPYWITFKPKCDPVLTNIKHTAAQLWAAEKPYLVHAFGDELSLAVDAGEGAVSRHMLQGVGNISRRWGAAVCRVGTWYIG